MYINKVVFLENEYLGELKDKYPFMIQYTDYGTVELINNMITDAKNNWEDYKETFDLPDELTYNEFKADVSNIIGEDLYEYLLEGKVDFCLIV